MAIEPNHYSVRVTMNRVSGISADAVTNTFHFGFPTDGLNVSLTGLANRVIQFYNTPGTGQTKAVAGFLAPSLSRVANAHTISIKNHGDLSAPVVSTWTLGATTTPYNASSALPAEVAVCASFKHDTTNSVPVPRRRGRVFLGPVGAMLTTGSNSEMFMLTEVTAICNAAMKDLRDSVSQTSSSGFKWIVWSPTLGVGLNVESGWTDTTYDIQRRRGVKPQGKVSWV